MATLTTAEYLDGGTARTAGEVMTFNGGSLTIRTDTRWHANAPASMTGTLGGSSVISATLGGELFVDSTKVRWAAYNTGSGNVPAIGTTITQGGVSGYLLGVWASYTVAPTAVGAAMPASGYIKFREVTSGPFTTGALTGIGASLTEADRQGWIEVVADQAYNLNVPRLGRFKVRGGWFELGTTTGSAGQIVQTPTNGGGAGTESPGLWIEEVNQAISAASWSGGVATFTTTAAHPLITGQGACIEGATPSGYNTEQKVTVIDSTHFSMPMPVDPGTYTSGASLLQFEFFPALKTTAGFTSTNLDTDIRNRFVQNMGSGQCRIGNDGTTSMGYTPPSGKRIRIPSNIFRQCATGTRATNAVPHTTIATRPDFTTTNAGAIDIEYSYGDWYYLFAQPYSVKMWHFANFDSVNISECATALDLWDGITGMSAALDLNSLLLTSNSAGGAITEWGGPRGNAAGTNDHDISINYCVGQTFEHCRAGILAYARSTGQPWYINQSSDLTFNYCRSSNGGMVINTSFGIEVNNQDHCDRYKGATIATTPYYAVQITNSCVGVKVDGMTFGARGAVANCHPYSGLVSYSASTDIKVRNLGARSSFLSGGSANQPAYIVADLGNCVDVKVQRCYMTPTRTGAHLTNNSTKNVLLEDVYGDYGDTITVASNNTIVRGGGGTNTVTGQASVYGTHFGGAFTSDTAGRLWLAMNEPTAETEQYTSRLFSPGSGFTSAGGLSLATLGDYYICEMQEARLQVTGFDNVAPTLTGTNTGNHSFEYQIDSGSGWNGSWKTLNGTNLSGESIDPSIGHKLKIKVECTTANNANLISYVRVNTTSTLAAQSANLYPLDTNTVTFTGLPTGCDAVTLTAGTSTILEQKDSIAGTSYAYTYSGAQTVDVGFIKPGYVPYYIRDLALGATDSSIPVSLTVDRNYA